MLGRVPAATYLRLCGSMSKLGGLIQTSLESTGKTHPTYTRLGELQHIQTDQTDESGNTTTKQISAVSSTKIVLML